MAISKSSTVYLAAEKADIQLSLHTGYESGDTISLVVTVLHGVVRQRVSLTVKEAEELRDALNKVLP